MKLHKLIFKEMFQRNNQLISSLIAISLGVGVIVGIKTINIFSEKAVSNELGALGANILILPKSASIQDYYSSDFESKVLIPEKHIKTLMNSGIQGIENISPKLSMPITIKNQKIILTGILPKNEFQSKALWQGSLNIFKQSHGCPAPVAIPGVDDNFRQGNVQQIESLSKNSVLVGAEIAQKLNIKKNDTIEIDQNMFQVASVLPTTGTIDDSQIFSHLHVVQDLSKNKSSLNVIEIVGCCMAISDGLIEQITRLLPDVKVTTLRQIVQTQIKTNDMMEKLSKVMFIIIIIVGGSIIANMMFANVYERRKEIGIYMSMGATSTWIMKLFMLKALFVGIVGGISGYIIGTVLSIFLGPKIAGIAVLPVPILTFYSILLSTSLSFVASIIPAMKASKVDPFIIIQEN